MNNDTTIDHMQSVLDHITRASNHQGERLKRAWLSVPKTEFGPKSALEAFRAAAETQRTQTQDTFASKWRHLHHLATELADLPTPPDGTPWEDPAWRDIEVPNPDLATQREAFKAIEAAPSSYPAERHAIALAQVVAHVAITLARTAPRP